jgi:hypothetical protein
MAVLGISTNTRLLGTAIITEGQLTAYRIRLFKTSWSASKATRIITSLEPCVRQYCINRVVLSTPFEFHQTAAYRTLHHRLCRYFDQKGIEVRCVSPSQLFVLCASEGKPGKKALFQSLCLLYPELNYYLRRELRNRKRYYNKLFEAVAAATLHTSGW